MFFFQRANVNTGVEECRNTPNAVLLDVREAEEFRSGHIPGTVNVPLSAIGSISIAREKPLFVYCLSGHRSKQAVNVLRRMGYTAKSIGGISSYRGQVER